MNRGLRRLTALAGSILFLLNSAGESFGLHSCPLHASSAADSEIVAPAAGSHDAGAPVEPSAHEGHHASSGVADAATGETHHDGQEPCAHRDACQVATGAIALLVPDPEGVDWVATDVRSVTPQVTGLARVLLLPYLLPYSQAPPALG